MSEVIANMQDTLRAQLEGISDNMAEKTAIIENELKDKIKGVDLQIAGLKGSFKKN